MAAFRQLLHALTVLLLWTTLPVTAYNVVGITAGVDTTTGARPSRRNLATFQFSGPAFDLYVQALQKFQAEDQSFLLSFYQVDGIHGYPFLPWDGVTGTRQAGYCKHGSTLFPMWHRPYIAIYERRLWNYAQAIAQTYPDAKRATYVAAAQTFRVPYWDWAQDAKLPTCMTTTVITINAPTGSKTITNPLYTYTFNPTTAKGFPAGDPLLKYTHTVRSPNANGFTQTSVVQNALTSNAGFLRVNTYKLLSSEHNYTVFSTDALTDRSGYNNVENIHNLIHVLVGGNGGHMSYTTWSSFDPVFWLHHANVDRITALWQAINPNSYVIPVRDQGGDFVNPPGTLETADTPLKPFRWQGIYFWTARGVRSTRAFGYTYPEIQDWGVDATTLANNVRQKVNALYNKPVTSTKRSSPQKRAGPAHGHELAHRGLHHAGTYNDILTGVFNFTNFFQHLDCPDLDHLGVNNLEKEWVINVKVDKRALPGPFRIHFFLSDPPEDPACWPYASNLVGTFASFGPSLDTSTNPTRLAYGQVPLSHTLAAILSAKLVPDIDNSIIVPLLHKYLEWRVQDMSGSAVPTEKLVAKPGSELEVQIAVRDVHPLKYGEPTDDFPTVGDWKVYKDVTKGKIGGCRD